MLLEEEIQKLVLEYKEEPTSEKLTQINSRIHAYLTVSPLTRMKNLDDDEMQELLMKLFVRKEEDKPSELERSLEKYRKEQIGRNQTPVSFLSYFKYKITQRVLDVCRTRVNYTARNALRRSTNRTPLIIATEPAGLERYHASSEDLSNEVLRDILQREVKDYFFQAIDRIKNPKYREPYLFSFLFADHLKYEELGLLFNIPKNSINANMKRAAEQFSKHFQAVIRERGEIGLKELKHGLAVLVENVRTAIDEKSIKNHKNNKIIRARFIEKQPPATVCEKFKISKKQLHEIEQEVATDFLNSLEQIRALRIFYDPGRYEGEQTMGFYENFMQYLNEQPSMERSRGTAPLNGDALDCHEIIKMALPTSRQEQQIQLRCAARELTAEGIRKITEATALTASEISAAIDAPEAYATQYNLLVKQLRIPKTDAR